MPYFSHENNFCSRIGQAYRLQLIAIKSISLNKIHNLILKLKSFIYSLCDNVICAYILICTPPSQQAPLALFFTDLLGVIRVARMNMGIELYLLEKGQLTSRHITEKKKNNPPFSKSHQQLIAHQLGMGLQEPFPSFCLTLLTDYVSINCLLESL